MLKRNVYVILVFLIVIIVSWAYYSNYDFNPAKTNDELTINHDLIASENFLLEAVNSGLSTKAEGTVFLLGNEKNGVTKGQITAYVNVDLQDWAGITIHIPPEWNVTGILAAEDLFEQTSVWDKTGSGGSKNWGTFLEIAPNRQGELIAGFGAITINLQLKPGSPSPTSFDMLISAGSMEEDGVRITGTDHFEMSIPLE